ncbi:hypothetical protein J1N35_009150 [Gossypium stocksii]|uniref:Uncharacterized protein n=1 Tax=Gossypium stocksii TaxID=47602 RepID=A0A9D3VYK3_9ROSI|nr:hypothetical protein J1N35_009150 [Gossypium stocksii]
MELGVKEEGKVLGYNSKKVKKVSLLSTLATFFMIEFSPMSLRNPVCPMSIP